jgi:4-amino-4-deoxy-L-arabinose transferase-like glycosyltransferase
VCFCICFVINIINYTGYPFYTEDEGTYLSQALAFKNYGNLSLYTYWYDHAPAGWIFLGMWEWLFQGFRLLGLHTTFSIDSGRIFIILLVSISAAILYQIVINITQKSLPAILAAVVFIFSPLAIDYHRLLLLDNIMIFWILIGLYMVTSGSKVHLSRTILSSLMFSIAVLSKEPGMLFLPAFLYGIWSGTSGRWQKISLSIWLVIFAQMIVLYPLYALLKNEFFPTGSFFGGTDEHVSLLGALQFQTTRSGGSLLDPNSDSFKALRESWLVVDKGLIIMGTLATLIMTALNSFVYKKRTYTTLLIATWSYLLFLIKGPIFQWYIVPILPFFAIMIGLVTHSIHEYILEHGKKKLFAPITQVLVAGCLLSMITFGLWKRRDILFYQNTTLNQVQVVAWAKQNISSKSVVLIDNYSYIDLNGETDDLTNVKYHYIWKVDTDPQIREKLLQNKWQNVDYLIVTPAFRATIESFNMPIVQAAYTHSDVIRKFDENPIYTVEVRKVNKDQLTI